MFREPIHYSGSSLIKSTKYNHDEHLLEVHFHDGSVRIHKDVPSAKVGEFEKLANGSGSAGEYYKEHIRDVFPEHHES